MIETPKDALAARLRTIDWYYEYSDDYSVWKREKDKMDDLLRLVKQVSTKEILELMEQITDPDSLKFLNRQTQLKKLR